MDGFEADADALENGIRQVVDPWMSQAGQMWGRLGVIEKADEPRLAGRGRDTEAGRALGMTCLAFASRYSTTATGLVESLRSYFTAVQAFRDTLQQVVDSYRATELRQQDTYQRMLRDI